MYKLCDRCRFHVPVKNALCNVCGSQSFSDLSRNQSGQATGTGTSNFGANVAAKVNNLSARIASAVSDYGRDLLESGVKAKSAAIKMKNLMAMPAGNHVSHDDVLSFHKNIIMGRRRTRFDASASDPTSADIDHCPVMQPFAPMIVKPFDATELEHALQADVAILKQNLDELQQWFENYGKGSDLVRAEVSQLRFSDRQRHAA